MVNKMYLKKMHALEIAGKYKKELGTGSRNTDRELN